MRRLLINARVFLTAAPPAVFALQRVIARPWNGRSNLKRGDPLVGPADRPALDRRDRPEAEAAARYGGSPAAPRRRRCLHDAGSGPASGRSIGAVYRRFPDKNALISKVFHRYFQRLEQQNRKKMDQLAASSESLEALLANMIRGIVMGQRRDRRLVAALWHLRAPTPAKSFAARRRGWPAIPRRSSAPCCWHGGRNSAIPIRIARWTWRSPRSP
jgi:hypothetical protein